MSNHKTLEFLTGPNAPEGVDVDMIVALVGQLESNRRKPPRRGISLVDDTGESRTNKPRR